MPQSRGWAAALGRAAAQGAIRQEDLLRFAPKGQLTLLHMADCHAQLKPVYFREPSINLGVGQARGQLPHLVGQDFLSSFGISASSLEAYMLTSADFEALAKTYGRVGGMDRVATVVNAIRAERGSERVLLLDGGDTLQGSYTALQSKGGDMIAVMQALGIEATTGHWEFTLGARAGGELFGTSISLALRAYPSWPAMSAIPTSRNRYFTPRASSRRAASASR